MKFSFLQLFGSRAGGVSWLSALAGILLFALLNLLLTVLLPGAYAHSTHASVVINGVAALLSILIAPFLLKTFDQMQLRLTRQNGELQSLHAIDRAIAGTLDLPTILQVAIKEVTLAMDAEFGALWLLPENETNPSEAIQSAQAFYNLSPAASAALTEQLGTGSTDLARRTGVTQRRQELEETWKTDRVAAILKIRSLIVVPIKQGEIVLGLVLVGNRGGALNPLEGFSQDDQGLLEAVSATVAVAVQNSRLYKETLRRDETLRGLIARTGDAIAASSDAPLLMQILADEAARILLCRRVAVYAYAEENEQFVPLAAHDTQLAPEDAGVSDANSGRSLLESFVAQPLARAAGSLPPRITRGQPSGDYPPHYVPNVPAALSLSPKDAAFLNSPGYVFVLFSRDQRPLGLLCLLDGSPRFKQPDTAGFARTLASQASVALENAQLAKQTQLLLKRTQALQEATARIAAELDTDRVLDGVVGSARRVLDADGYALWNRDLETDLWGSRATYGLQAEFADTQSALLTGVLDSRTPLAQTDPAERAVLTQLALPLLYAGQATGVMTLSYAHARNFTSEEIGLAQSFANQAANALENARLFSELRAAYDHQRRIAATLQESLLPLIPDRLEEFEFGHKYQAALDESVIGGDFYDLFPLGDHQMGLVMADVSGKGLQAAVQTALLKYTLRGFALETPDNPAAVLARVNDVLCSPMSSHDGFVTLFYGVLNTSTGGLVYANAGHEPPLRRAALTGLAAPLSVCEGLALGCIPGVPYDECHTILAPGDYLLLYTDGLTEARASDQSFLGLDGLLTLLPSAETPPSETVRTLYTAVTKFADNVRRDDVAMLVLKRVSETLSISTGESL